MRIQRIDKTIPVGTLPASGSKSPSRLRERMQIPSTGKSLKGRVRIQDMGGKTAELGERALASRRPPR